MDDLFYNRIDDFVYGECSEEEFSEFEKHMESCKKCKEEYELAVSVKLAMSSMPKITPPADFSEMLNKRLDSEISKPVKIRPSVYRKYSAVAACVALVAVLGIDSAKLTDDAFYVPFDTLPVSSVPENYINHVPESSLQEDVVAVIPSTSAENVQIDPIQKASTNKLLPEKVAVPESDYNVQKNKTVIYSTENKSEDSVYIQNDIPKYMDPRENVVLASTVEKEYQIKAVKPEDVPVKQRDLQAEFALLENPKTGNIIATPATLASLEGVQIQEIKSNGTGAHEYGVGSGSIFISSEDQNTVNELLNKYQSQEDHSVYYFTGENFDSFTNELEDNGINYEKRLISQDGSNVAFKVVAS